MNTAEEELTPEQKVQLAKQKKKDNELKKKQAAEEWKKLQALKKQEEENKSAPSEQTTDSKAQVVQPTKEKLVVSGADKPKKEQKEKTNQQHIPHQKVQQQSKVASLVSHLHSYDHVSLKSIREKYSNNTFSVRIQLNFLNSMVKKYLFNPQLLGTALRMNQNILVGSSSSCKAILNALKSIINDFEVKQGDVFELSLNSCLNEVYQFLAVFRTIPQGLQLAFNNLKNEVESLSKSTNSVEEKKRTLSQYIDAFINQRIVEAEEKITQKGVSIIQDNDIIVVYGKSSLVQKILLDASKNGKSFTVVIVDNPPFNEGKCQLDQLSSQGIETIYTLLSNVSNFIQKATKVFVGASSIQQNGSLVSRVGTALVARIAKDYNTPFYVFCESYKLSEKNQVDSLAQNELASQIKENGSSSKINLRYDLTPSDYLTSVIHE